MIIKEQKIDLSQSVRIKYSNFFFKEDKIVLFNFVVLNKEIFYFLNYEW